MRRTAFALALAGLLLAAHGAGAQSIAPPEAHGGAIADAPDVPPGTGRIRGRIVHPEEPAAAAGLTVVLYSLSPSGVPGLRTGVSDADGGFVFEGVSTDPGIVYLVGTRARGIPYGVRVAFAPDRDERTVEIHIADPSPDASAVSVGESRIRIEPGCDGLVVRESHELRNAGERTVFVEEEERDVHPPVFAAVLPAAARRFQSLAGGPEPGLEIEGSEVAFWGPLRPGTSALEFQYVLPATGEPTPARWRLTRGAGGVVVEAPEGGPAIRAETLRPGPPAGAGSRRYATFRGGPAAPGTTLELVIEAAEARPPDPSLALASAQFVMELDDAALDVEEQIEIEVSGDGDAKAPDGAPLLCLPLPAGLEGLQFAQTSLALGLAPDPSGALSLSGPLPPGSSRLALSYRIPLREPDAVFEQRFPLPLPRLEIFVADTGLLAESPRLHRRRPVASGTRTYLHLEGFAIEPDRPVTVSLRPLPRRRGVPRLAAAGVLAVAAAAALGFLAAPLSRSEGGANASESSAERAARERERVYAAIRDLDDDLEAGKISPEDHAERREALRGQAVTLLREERAPAPAEASAAHACPGCGRPRDPDARFCAHCGARLVPPESRAG